jgi:hypothetical protein
MNPNTTWSGSLETGKLPSISNTSKSFKKSANILYSATIKVGVPKKIVFTKIAAYVSVSNKSIS